MNNNLPLADIRAFITIAEQGSFTKASEVLGVSRAHLSRQLNQLEKQLNVLLLVRTTRSQKLTVAGQQFFKKCQVSMQGMEQAIEETQHQNQQLTGKIRINCVGGMIGEDILSQVLSEFTKMHPAVEVELDFSSTRVDLIKGDFDLVLRMGQLEDSGLIARKIGDIAIGTWASPDYLQHHPDILHPKDLSHHNCLTGSIKRWDFVNHGKKGKPIEINVAGNLVCKNGRALLNAAINGQGIVRLPALYCQKSLDSGQLVGILKEWPSSNTPLYLLYHRNPFMPNRLTLLIDHIYQSFVPIFANEQN